jgi:hypothetical protein
VTHTCLMEELNFYTLCMVIYNYAKQLSSFTWV